MKNKRGVSMIITTIIIILIVVICILLVWSIVKKIIDDNKYKIEMKLKCTQVNINFDKENVFCRIGHPDGPVKATIARGADDLGELKMKVILERISDTRAAPDPLGKVFIKNLGVGFISSSNIGSEIVISVTPIIPGPANKDYLCDTTLQLIVPCIAYVPKCNDNSDNDNDGAVDLNDFGCREDPNRDTEVNDDITHTCSDGKDNDGDGKIDQADTGSCRTWDSNEVSCSGCSPDGCYGGQYRDYSCATDTEICSYTIPSTPPVTC